MAKKQLSKSDAIVGACILVGAQLAASSTASCVEALPHETPSILRGLWRQVLTSFFFSIVTLTLMGSEMMRGTTFCTQRDRSQVQIVEDEENKMSPKDESHITSTQRVFLVATAVLRSTLLNDVIIIFALQYASSLPQ
eukprot:scaffold5669_cov144-Skeletonema_menzelii.AAC.5